MLAGAAIGFAATLDRQVATERLLGLALSGALSICAVIALHTLKRPEPLLFAAACTALLGGIWIISASGPDVFRGSVGNALLMVFRPILGLVRLTESVDLTNTRFIVGYNGMADLCLAAIFCCAAIWRRTRLALVLGGIALVLLVGTGSRGGLTGLAAGVCAIGIVAWPRRFALVAVIAAPLIVALAAAGVLDKGLEFSSTAGRLTYWSDLSRLLVEYPLTGVGLGVDTANRVALAYQINPDPERIFYAHNTFVQTYLEQGPLGTLGMLLVPCVALAAAVLARRAGESPGQQPLMIAGLGLVGGMEAHGLTDQVVTTNVGTCLVLLGLACVIAPLSSVALQALARSVRRAAVGSAAAAVVVLVSVLALPPLRAQALLNLGGLQLNRALSMDTQSGQRAAELSDAEVSLEQAAALVPGHAGVLRELARARAARFEDDTALAALRAAAAAPALDAFDRLQIAHVYLDLGSPTEAYAWAAQAYADWGRPPEDAVMQVYAQSTLTDDRARTLAAQAEAAMRARAFGQAHELFGQALSFEPANAYLQDRLGASQRAIEKYGAGAAP